MDVVTKVTVTCYDSHDKSNDNYTLVLQILVSYMQSLYSSKGMSKVLNMEMSCYHSVFLEIIL